MAIVWIMNRNMKRLVLHTNFTYSSSGPKLLRAPVVGPCSDRFDTGKSAHKVEGSSVGKTNDLLLSREIVDESYCKTQMFYKISSIIC